MMRPHLMRKGKFSVEGQAAIPWSIFGKKSRLDNLWSEESNYIMALRAVSLKRLQGPLEMAEIDVDEAPLEERPDAFEGYLS